MNEGIRLFVGLDVHKDTTAIAVAEAGREVPRFVGTVSDFAQLLKALGRTGEMLVVYKAGPCGYGLVCELRGLGHACDVVAPGKVARAPADRVKTDRRDALLLARLARAGELVAVTVPDERDEAIRDLSRAREDAVAARMKARQHLKAMLLRHGCPYTGKTSWTEAHERYLSQIGFAHPAQDIAFAEYRHAVRDADAQVARLTQALREQVADWRMRPVVEALMTLRGIELVAAARAPFHGPAE